MQTAIGRKMNHADWHFQHFMLHISHAGTLDYGLNVGRNRMLTYHRDLAAKCVRLAPEALD
jgi:hypothetical protein